MIPRANPSGHLDLSTAAASAAGVKGDPSVKNQASWKFVPCPVKGNVVVRLKNGNNNEMYIENEILPIQSVTCAGQTGSRTSYGAWHFGADIPGASCDLTDIAGRKLTVPPVARRARTSTRERSFPSANRMPMSSAWSTLTCAGILNGLKGQGYCQ